MVNHLVQRQAELLKLQGNECFKKGKLGAAIDAYTEVWCSTRACLGDDDGLVSVADVALTRVLG